MTRPGLLLWRIFAHTALTVVAVGAWMGMTGLPQLVLAPAMLIALWLAARDAPTVLAWLYCLLIGAYGIIALSVGVWRPVAGQDPPATALLVALAALTALALVTARRMPWKPGALAYGVVAGALIVTHLVGVRPYMQQYYGLIAG